MATTSSTDTVASRTTFLENHEHSPVRLHPDTPSYTLTTQHLPQPAACLSSNAPFIVTNRATKQASKNMPLSEDEVIAVDVSRHPSVNPKPKSINDLPGELLVHVLSMVSPEYRCLIRRVLRKWYTFGYHVEPIVVRETFTTKRQEISMPQYQYLIKLQHNPIFFSNSGLLEIKLKFRKCRTELLQRRSEFLTSPPISVISIYYPPDKIGATLRTAAPSMSRSDGIRLGDLLDTLDKMLPDPAGSGLRRHPYDLVEMWFAVCEFEGLENKFLKWHA